MSLSENGNGLSAADIAAVTGANGNGAFGWGDGGGLFWIIVLFLFAFMGGWGNNGFGGGNGAVPYLINNTTCNDVQRGFDQQALMGGITGLTTAVNTGFANAEVSRCNSQANILQTLNSGQAAMTAGMNSLAMGLQNCCCENRAGLADLKYTVATENCADRTALADGVSRIVANQTANNQMILDKLCQLELDSFKQRNADLLAENNALKFAQSQTAQTAQILANNEAQTAALERYLAPNPVPAYVVQNPNCCATGYYNSGCGCVAA